MNKLRRRLRRLTDTALAVVLFPQVGDELDLRMGFRTVVERRLCAPERDDVGNIVTGWYWTIFVRGSQ